MTSPLPISDAPDADRRRPDHVAPQDRMLRSGSPPDSSATIFSTEGVASPAPAVVMTAGSRGGAQQRLHRDQQDRERSSGRGADAADGW